MVLLSCNYNPSSQSKTSLKKYDYYFKIIIPEERMRLMSNEELDSIKEDVLAIENQLKARLIDSGIVRNVDAVNRLSLIASELLSNEKIS